MFLTVRNKKYMPKNIVSITREDERKLLKYIWEFKGKIETLYTQKPINMIINTLHSTIKNMNRIYMSTSGIFWCILNCGNREKHDNIFDIRKYVPRYTTLDNVKITIDFDEDSQRERIFFSSLCQNKFTFNSMNNSANRSTY